MTDDAANEIAERLQRIRHRIPQNVRLVAVTKTFSADVVSAAYDAGIRDFAENKVQEALAKQQKLSHLEAVTWHFIGHMQSNKSRKVLENFDWIHSVDSLKLAKRLDQQAAVLDRTPTCCLQVKLAPDPTKAGFMRDELMAALPELDRLAHLNIVGLMVIPPYVLSPDQSREFFGQARSLADEIKQMGLGKIKLEELSMGMSGDFEAAIAAGATLVRIGSGLFGQRR